MKAAASFSWNVLSADRIVHGDELGAVGKGRLDLDVVDHLGDAVHHLRARHHMRAFLHQLGDGFAVARAFQDEIGNQRNRLRVIELDAALEPPARHHGGNRDQQLVLLTRRQVHRRLSIIGYCNQSRGTGVPSAASSATRSRRSVMPSRATSRATAMPFQAEMAVSPLKSSARTLASVASSPGAIKTVASAMPPLAAAGAASLPAMAPSSRTLSANSNRPPRRTRQRSLQCPSSIASPMAARPNSTASAISSDAPAARSTSMRRDSRAWSNRIVSCGSQASRPPAATDSATFMTASGPVER